MEAHATLEVGRWYALVALDERDDSDSARLARAPLAEYVGDGEFIDEDGTSFRAASFDRFHKQS